MSFRPDPPYVHGTPQKTGVLLVNLGMGPIVLFLPLYAAQVFTGGIDAQGWPSVFKAKVACPSFAFLRDGVDGTAVSGLSNINYEIPDMLVDYRVANTIVPVSYWRAPGANQNTYIAESFFDELCVLGGKDPVEARRRMLAKTPRLLNVLNVAAEKAGWGTKLPAGRFRGVAVGSNSGSFCAMVAEVSVQKQVVRVHRVVCAIDCGMTVNPDTIAAQLEGADAGGSNNQPDVRDGFCRTG